MVTKLETSFFSNKKFRGLCLTQIMLRSTGFNKNRLHDIQKGRNKYFYVIDIKTL